MEYKGKSVIDEIEEVKEDLPIWVVRELEERRDLRTQKYGDELRIGEELINIDIQKKIKEKLLDAWIYMVKCLKDGSISEGEMDDVKYIVDQIYFSHLEFCVFWKF